MLQVVVREDATLPCKASNRRHFTNRDETTMSGPDRTFICHMRTFADQRMIESSEGSVCFVVDFVFVRLNALELQKSKVH